jgi:hypothetical protein
LVLPDDLGKCTGIAATCVFEGNCNVAHEWFILSGFTVS